MLYYLYIRQEGLLPL